MLSALLAPLTGFAAGLAASTVATSQAAGPSFHELFTGKLGDRDALFDSQKSDAAAPSIHDLQQKSRALLELFRRTAQRQFAHAGVDSSQPIELHDNGLGGIRANGNHPDRAAIEQVLNDHPELADLFQQIQEAFAKLHSVSDSASTKSGRDTNFCVALAGDQIEAGFVGE